MEPQKTMKLLLIYGAKDILISNNDFEDFINTNCFSDSNIRAFAKIQEIAPGIVVGRLQKEGYTQTQYAE
ncbi:MAG: hypothetical protein ACLRU1_03085 [Veillonella parvula]